MAVGPPFSATALHMTVRRYPTLTNLTGPWEIDKEDMPKYTTRIVLKVTENTDKLVDVSFDPDNPDNNYTSVLMSNYEGETFHINPDKISLRPGAALPDNVTPILEIYYLTELEYQQLMSKFKERE